MMKIAFFTEMGFVGKVGRNHPNMRTEFAWMCALKADHYPIHSLSNINEHYDLGIIIVPKKNIEGCMKLDIVNDMKKCCSKISFMQEGPHWYFQDYSLHHQIWIYNILMEMDFIFCHNEIDKKYFSGLTEKECYVLQSLMIEDTIKINNDKKDAVMIGGNFCSWYSGFDSYIVASELNVPIYIPSMGRKIDNEEQMENLNHLPYMNWTDWIYTLSSFKYGIHLMRTHAAGTFALNCAYLGIPCVGYSGLDTQEKCHRFTTVDTLGDLMQAKEIINKLKNDEDFYKKCSDDSRDVYKSTFKEECFLNNFYKIFE